MIITCPECDTRFVVPSTVFKDGGRKVSCAACKHQWFQEDPSKQNAADEEISMDDIVREGAKKEEPQKGAGDNSRFLTVILSDFKQGALVIITAFIVVVAVYFAFQKMMGSPLLVGQGLAFDEVIIERDGNSITASGTIVNAMSDQRGVPNIIVTQMMADNIAGDSMIIEPEKEVLESGETLTFSITIDDVDPSVPNIKFGFDIDDQGD